MMILTNHLYVSIPELKMAVAKALSVLIAKLDPNKLQAKIGIALDVIRYCITMGSELATNSKLEGMSSCTALKDV
jgi:hypothetical protein